MTKVVMREMVPNQPIYNVASGRITGILAREQRSGALNALNWIRTPPSFLFSLASLQRAPWPFDRGVKRWIPKLGCLPASNWILSLAPLQ